MFDRWGNQVHQAGPLAPNDPALGWDGELNGQPMNAGVFVYFVEILLANGDIQVLKGEVVLLR
ncbi:MAG: gliding motility-associated C-terminal domain-containing protein [Saprospiraceae bacterium]